MNIIHSHKAPEAVGPYSQAVEINGFVFCAGQIPLDPKTGALVGNDAAGQTKQVLHNLAAVLETAGLTLNDVVKTTVFLKDMDDFGAMNAAYADAFRGHKPARAAVQVAKLPKDALVEIECIAAHPRTR